MGLFDEIGKAQPTLNRRYDQEGVYLQLIERILQKETRKSGTAVILEKRNLMTIDPCGAEKPHTVGERCSHVMTSNKESFLANVRGVITQLLTGLEESFNPDMLSGEEWTSLAEKVVGSEQPLSGLFVICNNVMLTSEKTGKSFTRVSYEEVLTASQVKEMLEGGGVDIKRLFPDGELDEMIAKEQQLQEGAA